MKLINFLSLLYLIFSFNNLFSKDINFLGLQKLNINDLQTFSNIDLFKGDYTLDEVNSIIQDLYNSDLISDINLEINENTYSINLLSTNGDLTSRELLIEALSIL